MTKQIATRYGMTSAAVLERRIAALEGQVTVLALAVAALAAGLEGRPLDGPRDTEAARAARLAHDLLVAARLGG